MKVFVNMPTGNVRDSFFPTNIKDKLERLYDVEWNETDKNLTEDELIHELKDVDVCFTGWGSISFSSKVLENATALKVIAHTGGTVASLTGDEVYDKGIRVTLVCPGRVKTRISFYALEKDGRFHGKLDAGQAKGISPEKAARKIVRAIACKQREVRVGSTELLMARVKQFFPALCALLSRKIQSM